MDVAGRKKLGWALLSLGSGGTLFFCVLLLVMWDLPSGSEKWLWLWPILCTCLAIGAAFGLRNAYRHEPSPNKRWFHFSLLDITFATVAAGAYVGLLQTVIGPDLLLRIYVPTGFMMAVLLLIGTSIAGSSGFTSWRRYGYALSFVLLVGGLMGISGFLVLAFVGIFYEGWEWPLELAAALLGCAPPLRDVFVDFLRTTLLCIPAWAFMRYIVLRHRPGI